MRAQTFRALQQAGMSPMQACAIAHAIEAECAVSHEDLATKSDLADLRAATEAELAKQRLATRSDLAELRGEMRTDLANVRADLVRWLFLVVLGQTAALAAAGYFYIGQLVH